MLDRLIDLLLSFLHLFRFWVVLPDYERGIVLRLGRFSRELGPGIHWVCPVGVDEVLTDNVVPATAALPPQSLTTGDGQALVVSVIVTWQIEDIRKLLLEIEGAESVVLDTVAGEVGQAVTRSTWDDIQGDDFVRALRTSVRRRARPYGIEITRLQIRDLALCQSLRLFSGEG